MANYFSKQKRMWYFGYKEILLIINLFHFLNKLVTYLVWSTYISCLCLHSWIGVVKMNIYLTTVQTFSIYLVCLK